MKAPIFHTVCIRTKPTAFILIKDINRILRLNTKYKFLDLRYASSEDSYWLSWQQENNYSDPYLYCYDAQTDKLYNFAVSKMGTFFSDCCVNGKYFIHLICDDVAGKGNDFLRMYTI